MPPRPPQTIPSISYAPAPDTAASIESLIATLADASADAYLVCINEDGNEQFIPSPLPQPIPDSLSFAITDGKSHLYIDCDAEGLVTHACVFSGEPVNHLLPYCGDMQPHPLG
jgi:hypothetical protein